VIAVDDQLDPFGLRADVAPAQQRDNAVGMRIERANQNVEIAIVECSAGFGAKRGSPFSTDQRAKGVEDLSSRPDRVVAPPSMTGASRSTRGDRRGGRAPGGSPGERTVAIAAGRTPTPGGKHGDESLFETNDMNLE
jgi:hypothetical protein